MSEPSEAAAAYTVEVTTGITLECTAPDHLNLKKNDWCIVQCERHLDYGRLINIGEPPEGEDLRNWPQIKRQATLVDQGKSNENEARSKMFQRKAQEAIDKHKLPMKLTNTHYCFDRTLIIFLFTAPGRVDFRELVKDLNNSLNTRVELRQIGPRDQAAIVGGLGSCGRVLCCSSFLTNFVSINLKMAKEQGVSLNPSNIIGACGRLKCCLQYEYEGYRVLMDALPKPGTRCKCDGCDGRVLEGNPLTQTVKVALGEGEDRRIVTVPVDELLLD